MLGGDMPNFPPARACKTPSTAGKVAENDRSEWAQRLNLEKHGERGRPIFVFRGVEARDQPPPRLKNSVGMGAKVMEGAPGLGAARRARTARRERPVESGALRAARRKHCPDPPGLISTDGRRGRWKRRDAGFAVKLLGHAFCVDPPLFKCATFVRIALLFDVGGTLCDPTTGHASEFAPMAKTPDERFQIETHVEELIEQIGALWPPKDSNAIWQVIALDRQIDALEQLLRDDSCD
jgi:hypothetical protein